MHKGCMAWAVEDAKQGFLDQTDKGMKLRGLEGIYKEGASALMAEYVSSGEREGFWTRRKASMIYKWI